MRINWGVEVIWMNEAKDSPRGKHIYIYCNVFDQRVARKQPSKHGTLRNSRGSCVFLVSVWLAQEL
jgi:hypothetical protein